jgi:hypothetical protein
MSIRKKLVAFVSFICISGSVRVAANAENWQLNLGKSLSQDEAIKVAVDDLQKTGKSLGIVFTVVDDQTKSGGNSILVGNPDLHAQTRMLVSEGSLKLQGMLDEQGYEITTINTKNGKTIVLSGGSVIGNVYGLYWILDRMRVFKSVPELNVKREPMLKIRATRTIITSKEDLRKALRYTINVVYGADPLSLIPWNAEPEKSENAKNRENARAIIAYAHALHMKYLSFGTEFTYHPSLLQELGATLSPSDPSFWDAVQAKYRRLLQALPELDGVATFTGEEQMYWGNYATFDPIHEGEGCDWSLDKRYRTFIKKIHAVVSGEFDKLFYHVTWITNGYEQHSQPEVFQKVFTSDVPTKNLFLVPSFTQNDRWWFQAYNPTPSLTPHNMVVQCETMDYHDGVRSFPTFPGPFYQAGVQTWLMPDKSNLKGLSMDMPSQDGWDSRNLSIYCVWRLAWNPREDMNRVAEDFSAMHFGRKAAKEMAEIFMLSSIAYKYGLYIEPMVYGGFTSLPQLRVGTFPVVGYPAIDKGKEHMAFLQKMYLRCKPWIDETLMYLDHGMAKAEEMSQLLAKAEPTFTDKTLHKDATISLNLTSHLIRINGLYVKTFIAYFAYRDQPTPGNREKLAKLFSETENTRKEFKEAPGFQFNLLGIDQLLVNVKDVLNNLEKAEKTLLHAPSPAEVERIIALQQQQYKEIFTQHGGKAVKFLHWEGRIDGDDIVEIRDSTLVVKHLRWDPPYFSGSKFFVKLPRRPVTVIPFDIDSRPLHPFVLQQPKKENDYTVQIYLNDAPGGAGWCKFDLYYILQTPEELGLKIPWEE